MNKVFYIIILLVFTTATVKADPPRPPLGKRWIVNLLYSDEFNGTELDLTKWYNYHPTWKGRPPGLFKPSQVSVQNGYLALRGEKMDKDTVIINWDGSRSTYNVASGIIVSREMKAFFGYYECRFKAAKTTMSSTFWFSTRGSFPGPESCNDKYGLEWDVQECIGREGNFSGSDFAKGMHSNAHFWYTDCQGEKHDYRSQQVRFEMDPIPSEGFNTYGGWWINESRAAYYLNDGEPKYQRFTTVVKEKPFDRPMGMNLASETYPYPWVSLPTDEELADTSKNVCLYDWVRAYSLVGADEVPVDEDLLNENGGFETGDFTHWTGWGGDPLEVVDNNVYSGNYAVHIGGPGAPEYVVNLRAFSTYTLSCAGKVVEGSGPLTLGIKDPSEEVLGSVRFTETEYTRKSFQFTTGSTGLQLKFYFYAPGAGDQGFADDFRLTAFDSEMEAEETVMFNEKLDIYDPAGEKTVRTSLDFLMTYMANADREIHLRLFNPEQVLVGEQSYLALAGYANKQFSLQLDSLPAAGDAYQLIADIRPIDSSLVDTFHTTTYSFDLIEPADLQLSILDLRDDSPLPGALVKIGGKELNTDELGQVEFTELDVGALSIQILEEGFENYFSDEIILRKDTSIVIRMTPLSHVLTFHIFNSHTGLPLADALVNIHGEQVFSDHNGRATTPVFAGSYSCQVSLERYADQVLFVEVLRDTSFTIQMDQILADARFVVKLDNTSLAGASVSMGDTSGTTSPIGMAILEDLKTDTSYVYRIEFQSELLLEDSMVLKTDSTLRIYLGTGVFTGRSGNKKLKLYPNPANDHIRLEGAEAGLAYEIRDVNGRRVHSGTLDPEEDIDVSALSPGIYFLKPGEEAVCIFSIYR